MAKTKEAKKNTTKKLLEAVIEGIQERKGEDIVTIDLRKIENAVSDYFVICHANSDRQVEAIADSVKQLVKDKTGQKPVSIEGTDNAEWILMDYFDIVVHIFKREMREFYQLEDLWADAEINEVVSE